MCGFLVCVGGTPAGFTDALSTMRHRGPDRTTVRRSGPVTFGFHRLAIVEVDEGRQPATWGTWTVVFNGEIYNYRELREQLTTDQGAPVSEAEVVAAAFGRWGPSALHRLRGMFAIVAHDAATGTVHAARDPFGIKPLYHLHTPDGLLMASEKKALTPYVERPDEIVADALAHYLTLQYVPEPGTLTPGVRRLPPGHLLVFRSGDAEAAVEPWFRPVLRPVPVGERAAVGRIREALRDSVRAHLNAEVPVGAFLSGGVDSTAIVALAREVKPDIRAYTVGFSEAGSASEVAVAQDSADKLGVELVSTIVDAADVVAELPRIVWHLDDPVADPALVPLYFLARRTAQDVTVVLSGEGADELFGGYGIYREPRSLARVSGLPAALRRGLRAVSAAMPAGVKGKSFLARATTPIEERYYGNARNLDPATRRQLLRRPGPPVTDVTGEVYARTAGLDDVTRMQLVDLHTWLPGDILTKADRMTMAHSLELRVPFVDRAVYAAAAGLTPELKVPAGRRRITKYALREAVRGIVPDSVVDRRKLGFPTPTRQWLRGPLGEWADDVFATAPTDDLLDLSVARRMLAEHRGGRADHARNVWTVLIFCLWWARARDDAHPGSPSTTLDQLGDTPDETQCIERRQREGGGHRASFV